MSLMRSDREVAINALVVAAGDAAHRRRAAAEIVADPALKTDLLSGADELDTHARTLARDVIEHGDIPNAPSAEIESIRDAWLRLGASLLGDHAARAIRETLEAEEAVAEAVTAVLATDLSPEERRIAEALGSRADRILPILRDRLSRCD